MHKNEHKPDYSPFWGIQCLYKNWKIAVIRGSS